MSWLFDLLPAFYRLRDVRIAQSQVLLTPAEQAILRAAETSPRPLTPVEQQQADQLRAKAERGPLGSLLMLVEEQLAFLAENLDQLYDDQFIETCAPWVIPYIGDLIGFQTVNGIAPAVASPRAEVAHTISLRRRRGAVLVMEQLARDVTGWGAHAVEFFQLLATTQYVKHMRPHNHYAPDVRGLKTAFSLEAGFDRTAHTVDVRRIAAGRGRYNIQNIGIFLWSMKSYSLTRSPAVAVPGAMTGAAQCFRLNPLGRDIALFNRPVSQGADITTPAGPVNVPARLRRRVLCEDVQNGAGAAYYGEGNSLAVYVGGQLLNSNQIQVCDLSGPDGSWNNLPRTGSPYAAAIDPELGRIVLPPSTTTPPPVVQASFNYGFNADLGGGEYSRRSTFIVQNDAWVLPFPDTETPARYSTLQDALTFATGELTAGGQVAIEISDSGLYTAASLSIEIPAGKTVEFRAADGSRPTLLLSDEIAVTGAASSVFALNGIVIGGTVHAPATKASGGANQLSQLSLTHGTLVPDSGHPSLIAEPAGLQVYAGKSILGGMRVDELAAANLADCIVDSTAPTAVAYSTLDNAGAAGALTLTGCTVVGKIHTTLVDLMSNSIICAGLAEADTFTAPLRSERRQTGCLRFSYLPAHSATTQPFRCVASGPQAPQPLFFSTRYGDPGYLKLLTSTPDSVRRGADDGGEMGAFHFDLAPLREADLRVRLQEYTPVGLEFGLIYQN